jgi:hypothetical protein
MKQVSCDVLIIGGGVAGTAAAVAAARCNLNTILTEKKSYLGGTGYAGMFQYICGLYLNGETFPKDTLNEGIAGEITTLLSRVAPERKIKKIGQVYVLPYAPDNLQSALLLLCSAEKNLTVLRSSAATAVKTVQNEISTVFIDGLDGKQAISASMVIDCSGDGSVADMAGAPCELASPGEQQMAGYMVRLKGLKDADEMLSVKVPYHLAQAAEKGLLTSLLRFTTFSAGDAADEGYCKISLDSKDGPERDEKALRNSELMLAFLAGALPAFKDAVIAGTSLMVLDREGRRVCGEYTLTENDVLSARKFPDAVVKNAWPIELWDRSKGTEYKYLPRGDYYEIPFRCLTVKGISNLLAAGRCISVTRAALGSTRVMGTCMTLGEQAGKAAAYRIRNGKYPEGKF